MIIHNKPHKNPQETLRKLEAAGRNGKGDAIRPGANLKAYRDNYDGIFRKKKTI